MLGCFIKKYIYIYQLLFKDDYISDLKWTGNKKQKNNTDEHLLSKKKYKTNLIVFYILYI